MAQERNPISYEKAPLTLPIEKLLPSIVQAPKVELKPLPEHLKYVFLGERGTLPVIISSKLTKGQEMKLEHKTAIGWIIADIKGISPSTCMHRILLEDDAKPVVPKKSGVTVVENADGVLVPTRVQNGWRVCIDYRRLNAKTRKDHFPLPFIDQMLERLAGKAIYCFLDGYSEVFGLFHRSRFIKDFSKNASPLYKLLQKESEFIFDDGCKKAFDELKGRLVTAPIIQAPDWSLPFEIMCDASDYA
ncbi:uncharacterized protein LOC141602193 [Silene latifolia]|uniref:uncharacterized protein LOC141602193 n=1 Tax=Silene latifolia TaxID=37657 RepID=UPI003D78A29C